MKKIRSVIYSVIAVLFSIFSPGDIPRPLGRLLIL